MCISVDLPDPDGPMIAAKRPAGKPDTDIPQSLHRRLPLAKAPAHVHRRHDPGRFLVRTVTRCERRI